jgi:hypothetical protein
MTTSYRLQAMLPAPYETQLEQLRAVLQVDNTEVIKEALGFFAKAVLEVRQGRHIAFVDEKHQVLAEYSSPSLTRLEWNARDESRIVLPDSDFDRVVDELEKPDQPSPRLQALAKRKSR